MSNPDPSRVLITGAGGFMGEAITRACHRSWPEAALLGIDACDRSPNVHAACDLCDKEALRSALKGFVPDVVLHMAGTTRNCDWGTLWSTNVLTLANTMDVVSELSTQARFVIPGSAAEYGDWPPRDAGLDESHSSRPTSPYGTSKAWQTLLAHTYAANATHAVVGRVFNLAGRGVPPQFVLGSVAEQLRRIAAGLAEPIVRIGDASPVRDFIDIDDACDALLALAREGVSGEDYNICMGTPRVIRDVATELIRISGTDAKLRATEHSHDRAGIAWSVGSNAKILAKTRWRPRVAFTESLSRMLALEYDIADVRSRC